MNAEEFALLLGGWTHESSSSARDHNLARRLALGVRTLIINQLLAPGTRLPAERDIALALGVSRPAVTAALDELRSAGLVDSRQGSGTWIAAVHVPPEDQPAPMAEMVFGSQGINLAAATPGDAAQVTVTLGDLISASPSHGYDPQGMPQLRARLAAWLTASGDRAGAAEVVITNGAHHALALIIGALVAPGQRVLVEEHTYGGFCDLLAAARARPVPVGRDDAGVLPGALQQAMRRYRPGLVYLMPSVHAPTGTAAPPQRLLRHRAQVDLGTAIASQHIAMQILDGFGSLLHRRSRHLRAQAGHLAGLLGTHLPDWSVRVPDGGLCLWACLPVIDTVAYASAAAHHGVLVMPGSVARPGAGADPHLRICFDRDTPTLDEAVRRLAIAWHQPGGWS